MNFLPEEIRRILAVGFMILAIFVIVGWLGSSLSSRLSSLSIGNKIEPAPAESAAKEETASRSLLGGVVDSIKNIKFISISVDGGEALDNIGENLAGIENAVGDAAGKAVRFFRATLSRDVITKPD